MVSEGNPAIPKLESLLSGFRRAKERSPCLYHVALWCKDAEQVKSWEWRDKLSFAARFAWGETKWTEPVNDKKIHPGAAIANQIACPMTKTPRIYIPYYFLDPRSDPTTNISDEIRRFETLCRAACGIVIDHCLSTIPEEARSVANLVGRDDECLWPYLLYHWGASLLDGHLATRLGRTSELHDFETILSPTFKQRHWDIMPPIRIHYVAFTSRPNSVGRPMPQGELIANSEAPTCGSDHPLDGTEVIFMPERTHFGSPSGLCLASSLRADVYSASEAALFRHLIAIAQRSADEAIRRPGRGRPHGWTPYDVAKDRRIAKQWSDLRESGESITYQDLAIRRNQGEKAEELKRAIDRDRQRRKKDKGSVQPPLEIIPKNRPSRHNSIPVPPLQRSNSANIHDSSRRSRRK